MEIDISKSALVIVDMQNDFCHPEGFMLGMAKEKPKFKIFHEVKPPIENIKRLSEATRDAGRPVIYLRTAYMADYADCGIPYWKWPEAKNKNFCIEGTWGAKLVDDLKPQPGDFIITKKGYGGFYNTSLDTLLRNLGVSTCIVSGVGTSGCVDTTVREGMARGYMIVLASDATGGCDKASHDQTLLILGRAFAEIKITDEVITLLQKEFP